jgi:large subunit ribosomal protein L23
MTNTNQTTEDIHWKSILDFLKTHPPELFNVLKAISIPHWFNEPFFNTLLPKLNGDRAEIYKSLEQFYFIEAFSKRKSSVHDITREIMLNRLWESQHDEFMVFSKRAADYLFELVKTDDNPEHIVEWLYHLVVVDPERAINEIKELGASWSNNFKYSELEFLANTLSEHVENNRITDLAKSVILFLQGRVFLYLEESKDAVDCLTQALKLVGDDNRLRANILESIGETYQLENRNTEAVEFYKNSLSKYKELSSKIGQASVFHSLGKIAESQKKYTEALDYYENSFLLYEKINSFLGMANTLMEMGNLEQVKETKTKHYRDAANLYKKLDNYRGQKNADRAMNKLSGKPEPQENKRSPRSRKPKSTISDSREISDVITRPILTEKATKLLESNQYTFDVPTRRTKLDVKIAIEELFHVRVVSVNTLKPPRKQRRVGKFSGYKPCYKKAIVRLADGDTITLFPEV